jgi:hypothetical protein
MDPNAALGRIDRAVRVDSETREIMRGLHEWLRGGGFQPNWEAYPTGAKRYRRAYKLAPRAHTTRAHATKSKAPIGFTNISTTYQLAYQTYDGNVQVRKIGDRLWEILPRGGASIYEKSKQSALERAFQLAATRTAQKARKS